MFFKRTTKLLLSSLQINTAADLVNISTDNTWLLSGINDLGISTNSSPFVFSEGADAVDIDSPRGQIVSPGMLINHSIGIKASLGLAGTRVSNHILWHALLTTDYYANTIPLSTLVNKADKGQQLYEYSLIVITEGLCRVYPRVIVNSLNIDLSITSLATCEWNLLSSTGYNIDGVLLGSGSFTYQSTEYFFNVEPVLEHIASKPMIVTIGTTSPFTVPAVAANISISNSVSIIPNNTMDGYGIFNGYKLGVQNISGNVSAYLRSGLNSTISSIKEEYSSGLDTSERVSISIPVKSRVLNIDLGTAFIAVPPVIYGTVLTTELSFIVNNYNKSSEFEVSII